MMYAPIVSLMFMVFGSGFFTSFTSLHLKALHVSDMVIGLTQSCFYFGLLLGSLRTERMIARIGHIRVLAGCSGVLAASTLVLYVIPPAHWLLLRILAGFCVGAYYVGIESWLLAEYPANKRGQALAVYTISLYLSQSASQACLFLGERDAALPFIMSAFFLSLATAPVSLSRRQGPVMTSAEPEAFMSFLRLAPLAFIGCFFSGVMLSSLYSFMPVYAKERGLDPSFLMTTLILGGAILQWPVGKLSDLFERRKVLSLVAALGLLPLLLMSVTTTPWLMAIHVFMLGGVAFTIYPLAMALGCDVVAHKDVVKMTGVLLFAYGCGSVLGPLLTPSIKFATPQYLVVMMGLYFVQVGACGLYAVLRVKALRPELQTDFSVLPSVPGTNELTSNARDLAPSGTLASPLPSATPSAPLQHAQGTAGDSARGGAPASIDLS